MKYKLPKTFFKRTKSINFKIIELIDFIRSNSPKSVHLGCGETILKDTINCDLFNAKADLNLDATNLKVFSSSEIDLIEHHHMIEHLSFTELENAIKEWHRVLKKGGFLVFTCPNLSHICSRFLMLEFLNIFINKESEILYTIKMFVGSQENQGMFHKNAFSKRILHRFLNKSGFEVLFFYKRYPIRPTPSMVFIAKKV